VPPRSRPHLASRGRKLIQFRVLVGLDLVHVSYGGSGPAITSVVAGHTPIAEAFTMQMKLEMEKWAKVFRAAKIKAK
jgi:hypothetical protein